MCRPQSSPRGDGRGAERESETRGRDFGDSSSVEIGARVYLDAPSRPSVPPPPKALRCSAKRVHPHSCDVCTDSVDGSMHITTAAFPERDLGLRLVSQTA